MSEKNILQKISDLGKSVPAEAWDNVPTDLSTLDHGKAISEVVRLRQQLSEARGKIEELTSALSDECADTYGIGYKEAYQGLREISTAKDERIASLEAAIGKVLKSYEKLPSNLTPPKWLAEVRAAYEGTEDAQQ